MGETVGPDIGPCELEDQIKYRKALIDAIGFVNQLCVGIAGLAVIVLGIGNLAYWSHWVAYHTIDASYARFNSGWLLVGVCAVVVVATSTWLDYLKKRQKNSQILHNAMRGRLSGGNK